MVVAVCLAASLAAGQAEPAGPGDSGDSKPAAGVDRDAMIQLSFKNAQLNTVVQWLAKSTGKSIIPHKDVKCKLNIVSSHKMPLKEALHLVYRALALEGYSAIETKNVIMIVPEKMEPKVSAELLKDPDAEMPAGRQMVIKVFDIEHADVAKLKDKLKPVLSEKAKIEVDENARKVIVTDYIQNVNFLAEVLRELDVPTVAETETKVFNLKHTRADDLSTLLTAVFTGATPAKPGARRVPKPKQPVAKTGDGHVSILADKTSNRLVVTAPPKRFPEIERLIKTLDTEKPADVAVRLVPLKNVDAQELVTEINKLYSKMKGGTLEETIEISAVGRSNALIVLSSESNFEGIKELAEALDVEEGTDKDMRIFKLRYAEAEDVAKQLEELHDVQQSSGYYYWRYSARQRSYGNVRFVASRRQNELIAIGPPAALDRIRKLVDKLDQPAGGENLAPRIYQLTYVAAKDIEEVLNGLFKKTERRNYWWDEVETDNKDIGRLYGKVRVASEPYTNSLIITTNSLENFEAVEHLLKQLDVRSEEREATFNFQLKYAKAIHVANALNILFAGPGAPPRRAQPRTNQPNTRRADGFGNEVETGFELEYEQEEEAFYPWLGGAQQGRGRGANATQRPVSDLVGKVRIVPDNRTNSLLITTSPHFFPQIQKVVQDLDIPTAQVLIEAKIVEVGREDLERIGVRWSPEGDAVFDTEDYDDSFLPRGSVDYSKVFAGTTLENALETGVLDGAINLDVLIQFLVKTTDTQVRAEPRLNVADNERGKLFVGQRVPFIQGQLAGPAGGLNQNFVYRDVGIILEVTPHINQHGDVAMKVRVESSQVKPGVTVFGSPVIDTRNYRTEFTVRDGQTLVLGGIIRTQLIDIVRKVPILGDIPILGWLFKKSDQTALDIELMVFLRPTVTRTPEDVERLMEQERKTTPQIQEFAPDLYGKQLKVVTW